ncbi:alpha/beta hydrolase family protein [Pedobacter faecalis]|uniref:alpha/beta hydrolase family protein n=1 Tax=Pedobacter faecalis TaxID=3041495 RepID=UPI002550B309|nr:prolyl oligopeptidase family serine peptidase [Pedobacter sp. ELA7]
MERFLFKTRLFVVLLFVLASNIRSNAQKKVIDIATNEWQTLQNYGLSNNGKYVWYTSKANRTSLTSGMNVVKIDGREVLSVENLVREPVFSADSRYLIYFLKDSIAIFDLTKSSIRYMAGLKSIIKPLNGIQHWISYKKDGFVQLENLYTGKVINFKQGKDASFNPQGDTFLVKEQETLRLVKLSSLREKVIPCNGRIMTSEFSNKGDKLAYLVDEKDGRRLYLYNLSSDTSILMQPNSFKSISEKFEISTHAMKFSVNDQNLFVKFDLQRIPKAKEVDVSANHLRIWSHLDYYVRSQQPMMSSNDSYTVALNLNSGRCTRLSDKENEIVGEGNNRVILSNVVNDTERTLDSSEYRRYQIVSLSDGIYKTIVLDKNYVDVKISPSGDFVAWTKGNNVYCFDWAAGKAYCVNTNFSKQVPPIYSPKEVTWTKSGSLIFQDGFDIWLLDPKSENKPINLTRGKGSQNNTVYRIAEWDTFINDDDKQEILVSGLNQSNMYNGLYRISIDKANSMQTILPLSPHVFCIEPTTILKGKGAQGKSMYLLTMQSPTKSKNLILAYGNGQRQQLSNIHPEDAYNFLTSELVTWSTSDAKKMLGIIYRPENFDPKKKYPIIFNYYENRSRNAHKFLEPGLNSSSDLDIPFYVSNGYIVFTPDIPKEIGKPGTGALEAVESAAKFLLEKYDWIKKEKMGLQGHSFGGYETNYIAANSNLFAAAQSSAGLSDLIGEYNSISFNGITLHDMCNIGQFKMGCNPWNCRRKYLDQSPIFAADKMNTPLLLVHGTKDEAVPFRQSMDFFIALRSLQKPVWLLEYLNEGHIIGDSKNARDYVTRQKQFFDYYLRDLPPPDWLTRGITTVEQMNGIQ